LAGELAQFTGLGTAFLVAVEGGTFLFALAGELAPFTGVWSTFLIAVEGGTLAAFAGGLAPFAGLGAAFLLAFAGVRSGLAFGSALLAFLLANDARACAGACARFGAGAFLFVAWHQA
ncbi:MAG: hypothetical protein ACN6OD_17315, partial [Alcaligenes sp.]